MSRGDEANPAVPRTGAARGVKTLSIRPYLELVRVFLTPTAVADSYAGLLIASLRTNTALSPEKVGGVAGLSILLYWLGMAANDIFDLPRDRVHAPGRPLPSGRLSPRAAVAFSLALAAGAALLAAALGVLVPAAAIAAAAILYDAGGKRVPIAGNLLMGLCRALNFLLGASAAAGDWGVISEPWLLAPAAVLAVFIAGVTSVSLLEDRPFSTWRLRARVLPLFSVPILLAVLRPQSMLAWLNSAVLAGILAEGLESASRPAGPAHGAAVFVRKALGGIFFVDAGLFIAWSPAGARLFPGIATFYLLAILGWAWKARWMQRGSAGS